MTVTRSPKRVAISSLPPLSERVIPSQRVHDDLPRADRLIKNTRDQRTGDLATRVASLSQPHREQVDHVIACLRNSRKVSGGRADNKLTRAAKPATVTGGGAGLLAVVTCASVAREYCGTSARVSSTRWWIRSNCRTCRK
jgi:hypothetical protein